MSQKNFAAGRNQGNPSRFLDGALSDLRQAGLPMRPGGTECQLGPIPPHGHHAARRSTRAGATRHCKLSPCEWAPGTNIRHQSRTATPREGPAASAEKNAEMRAL